MYGKPVLTWKCLLFVAMTGAIVATASPTHAANLLENPSFESTSDGLPHSWALEILAVNGDGKEQSETNLDGEYSHSGETSLRLYGNDATVRWQGAVQTVRDLRPGRRYRLAARMRTRNVTQYGNQYLNCNVFAQFKDASGNVIRAESGYRAVGTTPLRGTHDWTLVETTVRVPEGVAEVSVGCMLSCSGTAWFDDVTFEPLVAPDWNELDAGRYFYHGEDTDAPSAEHIEANQRHLEKLEKLLEIKLETPVQYYRYRSRNRKKEVTGKDGNAHVERMDEIHSIFWGDTHEIVHLLTKRWGEGTGLLGEGIAVYLSGAWQGRDVDAWPRELAAAGKLIPLSDLVSTVDFRSRDGTVTYPLSGSFVKHLVETHGLERFRVLYEATEKNPTLKEFNRHLKKIYDADLATLESRWLAAVDVE